MDIAYVMQVGRHAIKIIVACVSILTLVFFLVQFYYGAQRLQKKNKKK